MRTFLVALAVRILVFAMLATALGVAAVGDCAWWLTRRIRPSASTAAKGRRVAVIATFYNANWCCSHLTPIAMAENVRRVVAVVDGPTVEIPGVEYVYPPPRMTKVLGRILTKLVLLGKVAIRNRCDVIVGYFLVPNGLWALVVAKVLGRAAVYENTAGPTEIIGGGAMTDNVMLQRLKRKSWLLERLAFAVVRRFDAVAVRGQECVEYLCSQRLSRRAVSLVGSVDCERFSPADCGRCYDLITVARMVEIKQPAHILEIVRCLRDHRPDVSAILVGDGPLLEGLRQQAQDMGIGRNVSFLGQVDGVERLLVRSKVFVLTSKMEGLSIALAEAMACGCPAVVSDVGELGELVKNGVTGWRVRPGDIAGFASRILELVESSEEWKRFSEAARRRAIENNGLSSVAGRWRSLLDAIAGDRGSAAFLKGSFETTFQTDS
jgi:glycosyltransferase involved in cell wall biosynthesis